MQTGKGVLVLRSGRRLPLVYRFGTAHDSIRAGYLLCDTSGVDPAAFCDSMHVLCDDGTEVIVGVIQSSDRYLIVSGRVADRSPQQAEGITPAKGSGANRTSPEKEGIA